MKKIKGSLVLLIVSILFILIFVFNDNMSETIKVLFNANIWYLLLCILVLLIAHLFRGLNYSVIFKHMNIKHNFIDMVKFELISQFIDGITPFSSGEQPYQIYYLKKNYDVGYSQSTGFVFYSSFTYQLAFTIISTVLIALNELKHYITPDNVIVNFINIGYIVTLVYTLVLFIITLDRKHGKMFLVNVINFLKKIKIIKDITYDKFDNSINRFFDSLQYLHSSGALLLKSTFYNMLFIIGTIVIPIFVMNSVMPDIKMPILASIIAANFIMIAIVYIPIPGGTIGQEIAFLSLFGVFAPSSVAKAGMLLWRFLTYYFIVIIGYLFFVLAKRKKVEVSNEEINNSES